MYTAESTGASMERPKMPNLRSGSKGGFEPGLTWLRGQRSTAELPLSTPVGTFEELFNTWLYVKSSSVDIIVNIVLHLLHDRTSSKCMRPLLGSVVDVVYKPLHKSMALTCTFIGNKRCFMVPSRVLIHRTLPVVRGYEWSIHNHAGNTVL